MLKIPCKVLSGCSTTNENTINIKYNLICTWQLKPIDVCNTPKGHKYFDIQIP